MADMSPKAIMDTVSKVHGRVDKWGMGDLAEMRTAVKRLLECIFYLAKLHLPPEAKTKAKGLKKPAPRKRSK